MKKKIVSLLLALVMCLSLLPLPASAAGANLPDWYFLIAIFKNVDADGKDKDGKAVHTKYSMTQDEIDYVKEVARHFEGYLTGVGVMRAHVDVVEIDETLTELHDRDSGGSYVGQEQAAPLLKNKVDLNRYDHVTCVVSLNNLVTRYVGVTASVFENGSGHSCVNIRNREYALNSLRPEQEGPTRFPSNLYVHEFLHFAERLNRKCGVEFNMHLTGDRYYQDNPDPYACFTDIMLNRVKGDTETGTGVDPRVWQYSPCVIRDLQKTTREVTIPSDISIVGEKTFQFFSNLSKVNFHSGITKIGVAAFEWCTSLEEVTIPSGVTSIGDWAFQGCSALTKVSIPASVTSIGRVAFYHTGLTDVYYGGTEEQWKAIQIGTSNGELTNANIHYNHLMADVKTTDWFAQPVMWAVEQGITAGTGGGAFSPNATCTQGQILTFLWRAYGSPEPSGRVSGSEYYAVPLQWAKEQGVISGSLDPNSPCTRADVVTYLWKLAGSPAAKAASFSDVPASAGYAGAVSWAVEQGVTSGTSATTFGPNSACTRGQIVTFLRQALAK